METNDILYKKEGESKMCNLTRSEKRCIRKRDAKRIALIGVCSLCNEEARTTRHHLWYSTTFCREAVIEVCDKCDDKLHDRNDNDNWVKELKAVRAIELARNENSPNEYNVLVDEKCVGKAITTLNGIKLIIVD